MDKKKIISAVIAIVALLAMISSQVIAAPPVAVTAKDTPPGQVKKDTQQAATEEPKVKDTKEPKETKTPKKTQIYEVTSTPKIKTTIEVKGGYAYLTGTVVFFDGETLTLELRDGSIITIKVNEKTKAQVPTDLGSGLDGIYVSCKVKLVALQGKDGTLTARSIVMLPGMLLNEYTVGIVTMYQTGKSITIVTNNAWVETFELDQNTTILPAGMQNELEVGSWVTIISPWSLTGEQDADSIIIHPEFSLEEYK